MPVPAPIAPKLQPLALATLILAGEVIFFLPFVLPRVFKPTLLSVFGISNLELGAYFSAYGLVAIGAYLLGGPLADRFRPHGLMATALAMTGVGGVYLYTVPESTGMGWLYAFWGMTTILLFWAAMLRATRVAGGAGRQGLAFGMLDGGRGLVAGLVASAGVAVLARSFPEASAGAEALVDPVAQREGLRAVIATFTAVVLATAVLVYVVLQKLPTGPQKSLEGIQWRRVAELAQRRTVWLNALIILCAYSGYRVLDDVSLLAQDALGYGDVAAARLGGLSLYLRPVAAIGAGLLADRYLASRMTLASFGLMLVGGLVVSVGIGFGESWVLLSVWLGVILAGLGVYALRGLYFALVDEGGVPLGLTGTAIGLASVVGYLPDIYMAPLMGVLLDGWPGVAGHRLVFGLAVGFAAVGAVASWLFVRAAEQES